MSEKTKAQLLQDFAGLDAATLQKLWKYSQLLIIPDENVLVSATMSQMVDEANLLADSLFPEWTDRSKSDFGSFLVELFALFSEKDFWYINAFANEGIYMKMKSYSNAFTKAIVMGYSPILCKGSSASFEVTFEAGSSITYGRGDLVVSAGGKRFSNDEPFTVATAAGSTNKTLSLKEGEQIYEDVTFNGHSVFIRKTLIDILSIKVVIGGIVYTRVNNFGDSQEASTHYMVVPEEDGGASIYFGYSGLGVTPAIGKNIQLYYRKCSGSLGSLPLDSGSAVVESISSRSATSVTMLTAATGGESPESLASLKEKAPMYFYTKNSAINETISAEMLARFSFVHKAVVSIIERDVTYKIIPTSGNNEPSESELLQIVESFEPYFLGGYSVANTANTYKDIISYSDPLAVKIVVDVIAAKGSDTVAIAGAVKEIFANITTPLVGAEYGGSFIKNDVDFLIRAYARGVQSVSFKTRYADLTEHVMADFTIGKTDIFSSINQENLIVRVNVI